MDLDKLLSHSPVGTIHKEIIRLDEDGDAMSIKTLSGDELPVLPLRNMALFTSAVVPISIDRKPSLRLVQQAYDEKSEIMVVMQRDQHTESPKFNDLFEVGTIARILKIIEMPDNATMVILHGRRRAKIVEGIQTKPFLKARVDLLPDFPIEKLTASDAKNVATIKAIGEKIIKKSPAMPNEFVSFLNDCEKTEELISLVCTHMQLDMFDQQHLLEIDEYRQRLAEMVEILTKTYRKMTVSASIQSKVMKDIDKQQREYFLHEQMKTIKSELGDDGADKLIDEMRKRAKTKKWNKETAQIFEKELSKLEMMPQHAPDFAMQQNYVETLLDLPWNEYTEDNFDLVKAQKVLDRDHFGLEEVKERIIEHLAVLKLRKDLKSPILCLYGPPGVGKTSLGRSIAESLGRKYIRVSLGGMHDEAEIRGHRRTYIGAMPGRIIQSLKKVQTSNPVFVLDEVDKLTSDVHGDPASALLEVLDPEQNKTFHDNFLDVDFDLSKVLFIATANSISAVPRALRDRMELIEVNGYIAEEKVEIAAKYLIPKQLKEHGIEKKQLKISNKVLRHIVDNYTRESGVRELERILAKLMRKVACKIATEVPYNVNVTLDDVKTYLGAPRYSHDRYEGNGICGVVTGLAWTAVGGEILLVEASLSKSKTPKLTLTGSLGDVIKESAVLALGYLQSHAIELGVDEKLFEKYSIHIHFPEGAVPKDGPSAGITILTALMSAFTHRKLRRNLAMTGEITLRGKVLPVGGIKEKILAAKRAGITDIIMCAENKKDVDEINEMYLKGLTFHFVNTAKEVIDAALL